MIRNILLNKNAAKPVMLVAGFFVLLVAALVMMPLVGSAYSGDHMKAGKTVLKGEVVAVDNSGHLRTLTLRSNEIGRYPNDKLNIFLTRDTKVKICGMSDPAGDLNAIPVGRNATITYHELRGMAVANIVSERC